MERPLILVTNDDGINSLGLWAAVKALAPLGELIVLAPDRQWSGAGRSMPLSVSGALQPVGHKVSPELAISAYTVDASPALCVVHAMTEVVLRKPALVVSGINFGENLGTEITVSGTVGAAFEAAAFGIPALAVSLQMPISAHLNGDDGFDYTAVRFFTHYFAQRMLETVLPADVQILNVNIPQLATCDTEWKLTRLSKKRYFVPLKPAREKGIGRPGYRVMTDLASTEPGSDIWTLHIAHQVSVTPLSMDFTSQSDFGSIAERLQGRS